MATRPRAHTSRRPARWELVLAWGVTAALAGMSVLSIRFLVDPGPDSDRAVAVVLGTPVWVVTAVLLIATLRLRAQRRAKAQDQCAE